MAYLCLSVCVLWNTSIRLLIISMLTAPSNLLRFLIRGPYVAFHTTLRLMYNQNLPTYLHQLIFTSHSVPSLVVETPDNIELTSIAS